MPTVPNLFGEQLGQAIATGAGAIAGGLQRKYEQQRQRQAQGRSEQLAFASKGIKYDPNDPESIHAAVSQMAQMAQSDMGLENEKKRAELNLINAQAFKARQMQRAPTNYRYNELGALEAIPGGPADQKIAAAQEKKDLAQKSYDLKIKNVKSTIDSALEQVGYTTAGLGGKILGGIGMTAPVDLEGALNTIKSNLGFDRLTQMRAESPTGGALGNVSDRELQFLTSTVQSLDQRQSPSALRKNLLLIKEYLDDTTANRTPAQPGQPILQHPQRSLLSAGGEGIRATRMLKSGDRVNVVSYDGGKTWQGE